MKDTVYCILVARAGIALRLQGTGDLGNAYRLLMERSNILFCVDCLAVPSSRAKHVLFSSPTRRSLIVNAFMSQEFGIPF